MPESGQPDPSLVRVWKYALEVTDRQIVELPTQHQILHVDEDPSGGGKIALWAAVRPVPGAELLLVEIVMLGTGHPFPPKGDMSHLGSVVTQGFVWHVFRDHQNEPDPVAKVFGALFGGSPQTEAPSQGGFNDGDIVTWQGSSEHTTPQALHDHPAVDLTKLHGIIASHAAHDLYWVDFFPGGDPDNEEGLHVQVHFAQIKHAETEADD